MTRAAVLIGVNKTGGLPQLADAVAGARAMAKWAVDQGMAEKNIFLFTDEEKPVEAHAIRAAIHALVEAGNIEQLIFYFAGHGVNIRYGEYWLLSGAPDDSSAAINVDGCVYRARVCGIPHLVFISDACRSAAQGIQGQGIDGSVVFPNDPVPGPEHDVDMFFATTLGRPALEVRDATAAGTSYKALYTKIFLDAVSGRLPGCMALEGTVHVVRPRLLKKCLPPALQHHMTQRDLNATITQIPDARVTSGDEAWLARYALQATPLPDPPAMGVPIPRRKIDFPSSRDNKSNPQIVLGHKTQVAQQIEDLLHREIDRPSEPRPRGNDGRKCRDLNRVDDFKGPYRHGRRKGGIAINGAAIGQCFIPGRHVGIVPAQNWHELDVDGPAIDVLIRFFNGSAALLPVIDGFITSLTIDQNELVDVDFAPIIASAVPSGAEPLDDTAGQLRAAIAAAARSGILHLDGNSGHLLAAHLAARNRPIDPALALYAAYGFHDQQMRAALLALDQSLKEQLSLSFFDIGLLSKTLALGSSQEHDYRPLVPLLARGWSLWASANLPVPEALLGLQHELLPSLWTHFTAAGAERLHAFLSTRRNK